MLIRTVVAPLLGTNCYVVGDEAGRCVVVDPGQGAADGVRALVAEEGLTPGAVLLTHGHADHTWDAADVAGGFDVPVLVHEADLDRLADPLGTLGPLGAQLALLAGQPEGPPRPARVTAFAGDVDEVLAPLLTGLTACHAPGHTPGSTVYLLADDDGPVACTGDVLFAGTIGRCDLPGGDAAAMGRTLARLARLEPGTRVLPGHGPSSTIAAELRTNPYLR